MMRPDDEATQVLPVSSSRRLKRHAAHPRNLRQNSIQTIEKSEHSLDGRLVLFRMKLLQFVSLDRQLGRFWIVLHRTTTQRIYAQIRRVVFLRKSNEVSDNFGLRDFRERRKTVSSQGLWDG